MTWSSRARPTLKWHRIWLGSWLLPLFMGACASAERGPADRTYDGVDRLAVVLARVEQDHVEPVDSERLLEGALEGMVGRLDPHSAYLNPQRYAQFLEDSEGQFAGIGVEVDFRDDRVLVIATIPGSPAERAGLKTGDRIVAVNGMPIAGIAADQIVRNLRGQPGSKVRLAIRRNGRDEPLIVTLTRDVVRIRSVEGRRLKDDIGYVRLKLFQGGTYAELMGELASLQTEKPLTGLILDLRGNPGGLVAEAVAIADEFLDDGLIYTARHRGQVVETVRSDSGDLLEALPLSVLTDDGTASSAEILAGALKDRRRASVVGGPTFGKGSVQFVLDLPWGGGLLLTSLVYFTPSGLAIQARGLEPTVRISGDTSSPPSFTERDLDGHLPAASPTEPSPGNGSDDRTDDFSALAQDPAGERTPIADIAPNPEQGRDRVLAAAYAELRRRVRVGPR